MGAANVARPGTLVIRSDANAMIGAGHVMRCLALGQSWQDQLWQDLSWQDASGAVTFVMARSTPSIEDCLIRQSMEINNIPDLPGRDDAKHLIEITRKHGAEWIVTDGYHFDENYQLAIKQAGLKLLLLDDMGNRGHYFADIVLNQNICADAAMYANRESYTQLLLGSQYVMLRREFQKWVTSKPGLTAKVEKILVSFGGSDPEGLTMPVLKAISGSAGSGIEVVGVAGGANPRLAELQAAVNKTGSKIRLLVNVCDMAQVMAECDLAIVCGGGTLWESMYMGCATLSYSRPGVQNEINQKLEAVGAIVDLGFATNFSESKLRKAVEGVIGSSETRRSLGERCREIVDGMGASRVVQALLATGGSS